MKFSDFMKSEYESHADGPVNIIPDYAKREVEESRKDRNAGYWLLFFVLLFFAVSCLLGGPQ